MGGKDDGLGCVQNHSFSELNLMYLNSTSMQKHEHKKNTWNELFLSFDRQLDTISFFRGIDVNRSPEMANCSEQGGVSSPNSTISNISGKKNEREHAGDETDAERDSWSRGSDDEDGDASRKKLRLSKEQALVLEETFKEHSTLNPKQKLALANELNLRIRTKLKQMEVDYEYLKRCCENITEENRSLHKEVKELRALKLSPQLYMHTNSPTTLTMCPSCERVSCSSTFTAAVPNCIKMSSDHQRTTPVSPWAAIPITTHRSFNTPSRS